jgi:hypothetical protein
MRRLLPVCLGVVIAIVALSISQSCADNAADGMSFAGDPTDASAGDAARVRDAEAPIEAATDDATAPSPSSMWSKAGMWVVAPPTTFPASAFGQRIKDHGFTWVALQIMDGTTVHEEAQWPAWIAAWRTYVPYVGAWVVNRIDPIAEADLAADKLVQYGFDFFIANAEAEYKYSQPTFCGPCFDRSSQYVARFRSKLPTMPSAMSSFGRVDLADIDWRAWRDGGFHFLPQTYWNDSPIYQPQSCVERAIHYVRPEDPKKTPFWTPDLVHPTIGLWGGGAGTYVSGAQYGADLAASKAAHGQRGASVYRGDMIPASEWAGLGQVMAQGLE